LGKKLLMLLWLLGDAQGEMVLKLIG
jgi:hypothetical protein